MLQIIKRSFQTKCTRRWAPVHVTSHSEHVTYDAAVTRFLHLSCYYTVFDRRTVHHRLMYFHLYSLAMTYFSSPPYFSKQDCSSEDLQLFASHCLPGPFGGQVSPDPDYQCSVQSSKNSPDWFPFLCVHSPPENNPYLGLFYQGDIV